MDKERAVHVVRLTFENYDAKEDWGNIYFRETLSKDEIKYGMEQNRELSRKVILKIYEWHALEGYSRKFANTELKEEGVPSSIIKEAILEDENNWFEAALLCCKKYCDKYHVAAHEIRELLKGDGFTSEEIKYALFNLNADWKEQAFLNAAKQIEKRVDFEWILKELENDGFRKEEIAYAERKLSDIKNEFKKIKGIIEEKTAKENEVPL